MRSWVRRSSRPGSRDRHPRSPDFHSVWLPWWLMTRWWEGNLCPCPVFILGTQDSEGLEGWGWGDAGLITPVTVRNFWGQAQGPCRKASGHVNFEHFIDPVPEGYRMGSEQGLQAGRAAEAAFGQSLGMCRCLCQRLLSLVSVMEMTVSSLLGWPVGILEPEPSSWTPSPTPSTLQHPPAWGPPHSTISHQDHCYNHIHHLCQQDPA